jgi:hypothetical protein
MEMIEIGYVTLQPEIRDNRLLSLGAVNVNGAPLRNPATRWLPWFDTYEGEVFRHFRFLEVTTQHGVTRLHTRAVSDPDALFRERRDSSGDACFRNANWDAAPVEADFNICFKPAQAQVRGRAFTGFKYWFEYAGALPIHRLVDRQTWEVGGNLDDVTICLRNWLTPPRMKIGRDTVYSTVGLDKWAGLLPGNLWGRWSLLPSFDMQYGRAGVLLGWFDEVSLIRTVIESNAGEDSLRCLDMHAFAQATTVRTNPKTMLWCPDVLDEVDALNLWLEVNEREGVRARAQLGIPDEAPPAIVFAENVWKGMQFDTTYEKVVDVASEFGADYVFIDPVWEHQEALKATLDSLLPPEKQKGTLLEKWWHQNMCVTLDFEVAEIMGGEAGLKALCDRAQAKGVRVISWMATHYSPNTTVQHDPALAHGAFGIFAGKESGRHPDTGYAASCWTANLNGPVAEKIQGQLLGVCERTGLAGFLWDSFCNLGWWQVDYSDGSMRPQFDKMGALYAALAKAGLYIMPEAVVTFSRHSCCGLHGGNVYAGDLLGYSTNSNIAMESGSSITEIAEDDLHQYELRLITGRLPIDSFFKAIAFKRVPGLHFQTVPREQWHPERVEQIKSVLALYKRYRPLMDKPTVMKDYAGVLWENGTETKLYFSFVAQTVPCAGVFTEALTGGRVIDGRLQPLKAYQVSPA